MNKGFKLGVLACVLLMMLVSLCSCGGGSSYSSSQNGYEKPNSSDKNAADYIQRVAPDLWNDMESNWGK